MFLGSFTLGEIFYSVIHLDYVLVTIHEALIYTDLRPMFRDYMKLCTLLKLRAEEVPESYRHDVEGYCQEINDALGLTEPFEKLRPHDIDPSPERRTLIKTKMNSAFGI